MRVLIPFFLALLIFSSDSFAQQELNTLFAGFNKGQSGVGVVFGQPFSFRYQRFTRWDRAFSLDLGYKVDDRFMFLNANYHYYNLAAEDRWRSLDGYGYILYNFFLGASLGLPTSEDKAETERVGVRLGGAFEYLMPGNELSIRVEVAPTFYAIGKTAADFQGGIIVLYYFGPDVKGKK